MSIDERLFALAIHYRDRRGPAALGDTATLITDLSAQAPDLQNEIRALAAAIGVNAAGRIAAAGNAELEAQAIAADIAAASKLPRASAGAGVAVARRLGPVLVVAYAQPPAPPLAPTTRTKPLWQRPWVIAGVGAVALVVGYQQLRPSPVPNGNGGGQPPELAPFDGPLPTLVEMTRRAGDADAPRVFGFMHKPNENLSVIVPAAGWDAKSGGAVIGFDVARNASSLADVVFEAGASGDKPARVMQIKWKSDELNIGPACFAFVGNQPGPDVDLRDAILCRYSSNCDKTIACGRIP